MHCHKYVRCAACAGPEYLLRSCWSKNGVYLVRLINQSWFSASMQSIETSLTTNLRYNDSYWASAIPNAMIIGYSTHKNLCLKRMQKLWAHSGSHSIVYAVMYKLQTYELLSKKSWLVSHTVCTAMGLLMPQAAKCSWDMPLQGTLGQLGDQGHSLHSWECWNDGLLPWLPPALYMAAFLTIQDWLHVTAACIDKKQRM